MDHYVIVRNSKEIELERYDEKKYEKAKKYFEEGRIIYESPDVEDIRFKEFKTIIWERFFNYHSQSNSKVIIPFTPDNIELMKENAKEAKEIKLKNMIDRIHQDRLAHYEAVQRKINSDEYKMKQENHRKMVKEMDKLIPPETEDYEAISKWRNLGYPLPPPTKITNLRKEYNKSWNDFIELCNNV